MNYWFWMSMFVTSNIVGLSLFAAFFVIILIMKFLPNPVDLLMKKLNNQKKID